MKKKIVTILIAMIIGECAAIAVILVFLAVRLPHNELHIVTHSGNQEDSRENAEKTGNVKDLSGPGISAEVVVSDGQVRIRETIVLEKAIRKIVLYMPARNSAQVEIGALKTDGGDSRYDTVDGTNLVIDCAEPEDKLVVEYTVRPGAGSKTLAYTDSRILLTNFLATPACYKAGSPIMTYRSAFGDPYLYSVNDYHVTVTAEKGYTMYAPGRQNEQDRLNAANAANAANTANVASGDKVGTRTRTASFLLKNARDFPLVLYKKAAEYHVQNGKTAVTFINAEGAAQEVISALNYAEKNIGPYPYDELFVVRVPMDYSGMEFSGMVFLSPDCFNDEKTLKRVAAHEVLHQWFYGMVGTNQLDEPFMDEGLVTELALSMNKGDFKKKYDMEFVGLRLCDYRSKADYYAGVYDNASAWFHGLRAKLGENYMRLLQTIYKEKKHSTLTYEDWMRYVNEFSGGQ